MTPDQFIVAAMELRHEWIRKNPSREPNVLWCGDAASVAFDTLASQQCTFKDEAYKGYPRMFCEMAIVHRFGMEGMMAGFDISYKKP